MSLFSKLRNFSEENLINSYLVFLLIGLLHSAILIFVTKDESVSWTNSFSTIFLHAIFWAVIFLYDDLLLARLGGRPTEFIAAYLGSGLIGLIGLGWVVNHVWSAGFMPQLYIFLFWANIPFMVKALLDKEQDDDQRIWYAEKLIAVYLLFAALSFLIFFFLRNRLLWSFIFFLFLCVLNLVNFVRIASLRKK